MVNFKLVIEYRGSNYYGWQIQKNKKTIQEELEKTLTRILQEKIKVISSGRTDQGVHALAQVVNFFTQKDIDSKKLKKSLNALLPKDIVVKEIEKTKKTFHSRFKAKTKVYRYLILNQEERSAFMQDLVYYYPYPLDIKLMKKAATFLVGRHNFKAFAKLSRARIKSTFRTIKKILIKRIKDNLFNLNLIKIEIEADGFLHNMVRNIVGTLIDVGRKRITPQEIKRILKSENRELAGPCAPASGLYLVRINY